ncbi:hypothetical protein [Streptomyces sp. I05A-00742]|uniref:NucA/NucB deoxyribonuclease domain-containing protein n=1 Tax=Streptomyces sp. I05A-00742 TaxID=2732853 RepID=UPI002016DFB2|nr:hypothetical protein [Streptomyces sp. I05A-00742]
MRHWVIYATLDVEEKVSGYATVFVAAAAWMPSLPHAQWAEDIEISVTQMSNVDEVTLALSSTCSGQCVAGPPAWGGAPARFTAAGQHKSGSLTYRSTVGKGFHSTTQPTYRVTGSIVDTAGESATIKPEWWGPEVRCDHEVDQWAGCIVPRHTAKVTFSKSVYHGAAVAYEWAQKKLLGHFGDAGHPLTRWVDPLDPKAKKRRALTCDRAPDPFISGATGVPNDSCDEYPFARSWQGGNPGTQCVDITPRQIGGVWDIAGVTVDRGTPPDAPCVRAHVDLKDNEEAGGEFGRAVKSDRIIDSEAFIVVIVP